VYWWRYLDASGDQLPPDGIAAPRSFATRSEAEDWLRDFCPDLTDAGAVAVTLICDEIPLYNLGLET